MFGPQGGIQMEEDSWTQDHVSGKKKGKKIRLTKREKEIRCYLWETKGFVPRKKYWMTKHNNILARC